MSRTGVQARVYKVEDIQQMLGIGRSKTYIFLEQVFKQQKPFRVIRVGNSYRIPKDSFDKWIDGE